MDEDLSEAWRRAGKDLGIRVNAPFEFHAGDGLVFICAAHILDFGSPNGAIVLGVDNQSIRHSLGQQWCSVCYEDYRVYDRGLFVDTLNDWG